MYTAEVKLGGCWFGNRQVPRQLHKNIRFCMAREDLERALLGHVQVVCCLSEFPLVGLNCVLTEREFEMSC